MLMLNNSFSSHIALATAECTALVINESFIVDNYKSSSCSDNDEFSGEEEEELDIESLAKISASPNML